MQEELYSLTGQKVLIIGGSSRMGLEVAQLSAKLGAQVIISSRSNLKLEAAIAVLPGAMAAYAANAARPQEAAKLLQDLAPLDHIVVTAASGTAASSIPNTSPDVAEAAFSRFWIAYHVLLLPRKRCAPLVQLRCFLAAADAGLSSVMGFGAACMAALKALCVRQRSNLPLFA